MSTINGSVDPLYVIDGIVVSNAAIPNGQNAVSCAQCGGNPRNQDNPVNRIADLNPEDIERIEVLKGGSAAAIYGSKATNGVVIITTKRGQVGKPQFSFSQKVGAFSRAASLGSRTFATLNEALSVFKDTATVTAAFQPGRTFNFEDELYGRKALSYETDASVSGGTENTKYYISGLIKNDEGIALNTGYKKQSLRSNIDQELGSGLQLQVNLDGTHSLSNRGLSNNDNSGTSPFVVLSATPSFVDLLPAGGIQSGQVATDFPTNPFGSQQSVADVQLPQERGGRLAGAGNDARFGGPRIRSARSNLQFIGIGGVDYFQQDNNLVSPPELQFENNDGQPGTVVLSKSSNRNLNASLNLTHTLTPSGADQGTQWTTSGGIQYEERDCLPRRSWLGHCSGVRRTRNRPPARLSSPAGAGAGPRHFRTGRSAPGRSPAAAHGGPPGRSKQLQRQHRQILLLPQGGGVVPIHSPVRRHPGAQTPGRLRADRQPGTVRVQVRHRLDRHHWWPLRDPDREPGRRSADQTGTTGRVSRAGSMPLWPTAEPS